MNAEPYNFLRSTQAQFDRIASMLELDSATRELLRNPMRDFQFTIPVRMDDGISRIFFASRIQHNDALGPAKGGIRFHPLEGVGTYRALAMLMTWKSAVVDLPLGGSMGGVDCDLHDLSSMEQERLCRGWVRQAARNIGPEWDVPGPDLMANPQHMLWMLDEYEALHGKKQPGLITGKPLGFGGSKGRKEADGYGLMITVRETLCDLEIEPSATRASVQGFGTVGQHFIDYYQKLGGTVTCVACWNQEDLRSYAFWKKDGIDLSELQAITNRYGEIDKVQAVEKGYEMLPGEAWIEQNVDILVPAAIENQINSDNVGKIKRGVRIIAEGANGATTPDADAVLASSEIMVIPDLLANAGGIICSYFEQVQGNMNYYWREDEVLGKLDVQLTDAYADVWQQAKSWHVSMRDAAYLIAVNRVAHACQERGWV